MAFKLFKKINKSLYLALRKTAFDFDLCFLTLYNTQFARNFDIQFDCSLKFDKQIAAFVKSCFYQLRRLSKFEPFLSTGNFETAIHAFVPSRLDYCNSLYYGTSQDSISHLQLVQNTAATLLKGKR